MLDVLNKALNPLQKKMRLLSSRCILTSAENKGLLTAQVEALEGETIEGGERLENYGLAGHPPAGAEGAMLAIGGARDHPLIVGLEHREHRPEVGLGEVKLYSMFKQFIHLDEDGNIHIKAPRKLIIEAESLEATLGKNIVFKAGQDLELKGQNIWADAQSDLALTSQRFGLAASENATVDSGLDITQGLTAQKDITSKSQVRDSRSTMQAMRDIYNRHTHPTVGETGNKM